MKRRLIICLLFIVIFITGCFNKKDPDVVLNDPNIEYNSFYDGKYGTTGKLEGNSIVVSIFVNEKTTEWTNSGTDKRNISNIHSKLRTATRYLTENAKKYNKTATFIYDWETYSDLKYKATFKEDLLTTKGTYYKIQKAWIKENINSKALKNKYKADNIIYMFFINTEFQNQVKPWTITHNNCSYCDIEYSNIFYRFQGIATPAATFAHEILHQFGAPDFYYANDYINQRYVDHLEGSNSKDIMFYINKGTSIDSKFTALDAYYVGIGSRPKEANDWNLNQNEFERG
jgi:hypothetical protein